MLTNIEMDAIRAVLVDGNAKEDDYNLCATLRHELRCDNHQLHTLYAIQINKTKEEEPVCLN
jgi:hypothetical protein